KMTAPVFQMPSSDENFFNNFVEIPFFHMAAQRTGANKKIRPDIYVRFLIQTRDRFDIFDSRAAEESWDDVQLIAIDCLNKFAAILKLFLRTRRKTQHVIADAHFSGKFQQFDLLRKSGFLRKS